LESLKLSETVARATTEEETEAIQQKDEAILCLLAQLTLIYWRPDFNESQAKQLYLQYLDDLRPYAVSDIARAIAKYRRGPEKFYPTPGQIRGIIECVPSWDVISQAKHISQRLAAGRAELAIIARALSVQVKDGIERA
jgi:hypothetical protein